MFEFLSKDVRLKDLECLLNRFKKIKQSITMSDEIRFGISLCEEITKEYMIHIQRGGHNEQ